MKIPDELKQQILNHCKTAEPQEACGFVVSGYRTGELVYLPCENVAVDPVNYFEIDADAFVRAELQGEIVAVVHSHPDSETEKGLPYLSTADRECQIRLNLPFWLVCGGEIHIFRPIPPLLGRKFENVTQDCRVLCLDAYMLAGWDITTTQSQYAFDWFEYGHNFYEQGLQKLGFERLSESDTPQLGDVVLLQVGSPVANHAGVYLGNQMMLHHSLGRLSARVPYDGFWLDQTHGIWRCKQWQQLNFTAILNDLSLQIRP